MQELTVYDYQDCFKTMCVLFLTEAGESEVCYSTKKIQA